MHMKDIFCDNNIRSSLNWTLFVQTMDERNSYGFWSEYSTWQLRSVVIFLLFNQNIGSGHRISCVHESDGRRMFEKGFDRVCLHNNKKDAVEFMAVFKKKGRERYNGNIHKKRPGIILK